MDIPGKGRYRLTNAKVPSVMLEAEDGLCPDPDGIVLVDICVSDAGTIERLTPAGAANNPGIATVDLMGAQVWSCLVDIHCHLDKSHTWPNAPNRDGSLDGAREAARRAREAPWDLADVRRRMDFSLRCAFVHGTAALRTHIDSQQGRAQPSWQAFAELRNSWRGRIELQAVTALGLSKLMGSYGDLVADLAAEHGAALGPVVYPSSDLDLELGRAFDLAESCGLDLDFHVDETGEPEAHGLRHIAIKCMKRSFPGRIVCGHACNLSRQTEEELTRTLRHVKDAGLYIVALPMTNLYLQDRSPDRTPTWRGITMIRELVTAGIPLAIAGDNCRDPFHPYGDHDMVDVFRDAVRIAHLDMPVGDWLGTISVVPANMMALSVIGRLRTGGPADFIIHSGRDYSEILSRIGAPRTVVRRGRQIEERLPDYRELD